MQLVLSHSCACGCYLTVRCKGAQSKQGQPCCATLKLVLLHNSHKFLLPNACGDSLCWQCILLIATQIGRPRYSLPCFPLALHYLRTLPLARCLKANSTRLTLLGKTDGEPSSSGSIELLRSKHRGRGFGQHLSYCP